MKKYTKVLPVRFLPLLFPDGMGKNEKAETQFIASLKDFILDFVRF
jgi:hypothetical protein